jgi:hypothetical protein
VHHTDKGSTTLSEQKRLMVKPKVRKAISRIKTDSVSLLVHRDNASLASKWTDRLSKLSYIFDFDTELLSSTVYERVFRSSLKQLLRQRSLAAPASISHHCFLFVRPDSDHTGVIILDSLNRATEHHPIQVAILDDLNPNKLSSFINYGMPLTIVYLLGMKHDNRHSLECLGICEQLELSSTLPVVVFFSAGLRNDYSFEPRLIVEQIIEKLKATMIGPVSWFNPVFTEVEKLDRFTDYMVKAVLDS